MPVDVDATIKYHDLRRIADLASLVDARESEIIEVAGWLVTERERSERLRRAFLKAEGALEDWCPQQDQTMDSYLRRWGLQADDLAHAQPEDGAQ